MRAVERHRECKTPHFSIFRITGYYDQGQLWQQIAKTPIYPVMCPLPLVVALCDHNLPTLLTDGRTDVMHVAMIEENGGD